MISNLGWWRYDPRTSRDLEKLFQLGHNECQLLICGAVYCIDFQNYYQFPKLQPARKRNIKRGTKNIPHLGVAGIR